MRSVADKDHELLQLKNKIERLQDEQVQLRGAFATSNLSLNDVFITLSQEKIWSCIVVFDCLDSALEPAG